MGSYKANTLKRIIKVQNITLHYKARRWTQKEIFEKKIEDKFCISLRTYNRYMAINAKAELKKLENIKNN